MTDNETAAAVALARLRYGRSYSAREKPWSKLEKHERALILRKSRADIVELNDAGFTVVSLNQA